MEVGEGGGEVSQLVRPPRRPDVDVVRVALTWGILLFHTTVAYAPGMTWYVKSFGWSPGADWVSTAWVLFMDIWQMPMFFFLSGVSAYFALFWRTERQFHEERVHRLFVPWLVLSLLNGLYSIAWLAPLTPNCEAAYRGQAGNSSTSGIEWTHCENYWVLTENTSFTKVLDSLLCWWHPNHGPKDTACWSVPQASKILGSMCFFIRPAATPEELVTAIIWWLGHPIKLALYPILAFMLPELVRPFILNLLGNLFLDWANHFNYTITVGSIPVMLLLATLVTATISFAIMKLGLLRYWFGLSPPKQSLLPGFGLSPPKQSLLPDTVHSTLLLVVVVVLVTCIQAV